jgi:Nitroreductase family
MAEPRAAPTLTVNVTQKGPMMAALTATPLHAHDFPSAGDPGARLLFLVHYAVQAPSGHNTQPWLFDVGKESLDLIADGRRALPVVDPFDRELTISCGAALDHLIVAASAFGETAVVRTFPDSREPDLLATVRLGAHRAPTPDETALFDTIPRRRTNRHRFEDRPVPPGTEERLVAVVADHGARLVPLHDEASRHAVAEIVAEGDRMQFDDASFRRELAAWIHPRRSGDGLAVPAPLEPMVHFVMRTFDQGDRYAARDRQLAEGSPLLAVLETDTDDAAAWLACGRALSRLLLTAAVDGVSASFLNQPIEVSGLRPRLAAVAGGNGHPQLLLRFGYGPEVPPAARRPVEDVLV